MLGEHLSALGIDGRLPGWLDQDYCAARTGHTDQLRNGVARLSVGGQTELSHNDVEDLVPKWKLVDAARLEIRSFEESLCPQSLFRLIAEHDIGFDP